MSKSRFLRFVSFSAGLTFLALILASGAARAQGHPEALQALVDGRPHIPGELIVQFKAGASPAEKARGLDRMAASIEETLLAASQRWDGRGDLELLRLPPGLGVQEAIRRFSADPAVEYAEPNWVYHHQATSNDPYYTGGSLWGMYGNLTAPANAYGCQAGEAWGKGQLGSRGVFVGVIDEGIQIAHPDLAANIWSNSFDPSNGVDDDGNGYVDDLHGWDFVSNDATVYDGGKAGKTDAHGTHVAGTIGALGGNGIGVAGLNWQVTIISGKFLGRSGGTTANAIKAVDYMTDLKLRHGFDLVATNNSWGGGGFSQALLDAIARGARADILFIAAAGNSGTNNDASAYYPGNYDTTSAAGYNAVIAVASITSSGALSSFSNYGTAKVALGAPGSGIYSTLPVNKYGSYSGTSMATPHVTGTAALAASIFSARGASLRSLVLGTVLPTPSLSGKTATGGRVNAGDF